MADRQDSRFLVVIHDVAWPFSEELRTVVGIVRNLVGSQFAAGLVPLWHSRDARAEQQRILELISDCDEYTRTFLKYIWAILHPSGRVHYPDTIR